MLMEPVDYKFAAFSVLYLSTLHWLPANMMLCTNMIYHQKLTLFIIKNILLDPVTCSKPNPTNPDNQRFPLGRKKKKKKKKKNCM